MCDRGWLACGNRAVASSRARGVVGVAAVAVAVALVKAAVAVVLLLVQPSL